MWKASPVSRSCQVHVSNLLLYLRTKVLRSALTNGHEWIFLLIKFNENYDGASYKQSTVVQFGTMQSPDGQMMIPGPWPDLIAAILSHWVSLMLICRLNCWMTGMQD